MEDELFETESGYSTGSGIDGDTMVDTDQEMQEVFAISQEQLEALVLSSYELGQQTTTSGNEETENVNNYDFDSGFSAILDSLSDIDARLETLSGVNEHHNLSTAINDYYLSEYLMVIIIVLIFGYITIKSIINNVFHL